MRGLSTVLFWNLLLLKWHIARLFHSYDLLQHSYRADIVTAAWGGLEGERRRKTEKGKSEERVPWERVPVLHSSKSPPACQWGDSPAAAAAAAAEQSSGRGPCWHCTAVVLGSHITHSCLQRAEHQMDFWSRTLRNDRVTVNMLGIINSP